MPSFTKRNGRYQIRFKQSHRQPREKSVSLPLNISKSELKRIEGEINAAYFNGEFDPWRQSWQEFQRGEGSDTYLLGYAINDYIARCERNNIWNSDRTRENNELLFNSLSDILGEDRPVSDIGNEDIVFFFQVKDVSPGSERTYLKNIKALFNWLRGEGCNIDPIDYNPPKKTTNQIIHFSESELNSIIKHVHESERRTAQVFDDIWNLMFYQCLRAGEVFKKRRGNVVGIKPTDIHTDTITVIGKGNKTRVIPIVAPIRERLLELKYEAEKNGNPTIFPLRSKSSFFDETKKIIRKVLPAHREILNLHALRRGGGVYWVQRGVPLAALKELLGHESIRTTEKYYARFQPSGMKEVFG